MKDKIIEFIRNNVLGKQLVTDELSYLLEEGKLQGIYSDKMIFSDLAVTENGFQFNMTVVTEEQIYTRDEAGDKGDLVRDYTGAGVYHYELAERRSSGQMTGVMRLLSATVRDHTMEAVVYGVYDVMLTDGELKWKEQQLLYRDNTSDADSYRAVAFDADIRFYLENGKLRFVHIPSYWNVNTKTMEKTLSKDQLPAFVSKEK
ncbi:hypothetical protein [Prevotella sp. 10(H)]|uniref:hypothetical protein n=1 Tax=Prevotella sp. 10(H) TaxID=1158294 RepID=UPI0004A72E0A|nr:hypothetical protein [Prevotella sp. 10(H)]